MKSYLVLGLCSLSLFYSCGPASKSSTDSSSEVTAAIQLLDANSVQNFDSLPLNGNVDNSTKFWSGDHWPINRGMINNRWFSPSGEVATISPTKEEVAIMTRDQLSLLSPSEKFDLLTASYSYPIKTEVTGKLYPNALSWEGIGNGWAISSLMHDEPAPKDVTNAEGLVIPFGSADIKALLSYYYSFGQPPTTRQLGLRCDQKEGWHATYSECNDDLNPGAFHIVLTNRIGLQGKGLIADLDRYSEVWNHPIFGFKTEVVNELPAEGAPSGVAKVLYMRTSVYYADKGAGNSWFPVKNTGEQEDSARVYTYHLHLNANGDIIGGQWKSSDRPDFVWVLDELPGFTGRFSALYQLL